MYSKGNGMRVKREAQAHHRGVQHLQRRMEVSRVVRTSRGIRIEQTYRDPKSGIKVFVLSIIQPSPNVEPIIGFKWRNGSPESLPLSEFTLAYPEWVQQ